MVRMFLGPFKSTLVIKLFINFRELPILVLQENKAMRSHGKRILMVVQDEFLSQCVSDFLAEEGFEICPNDSVNATQTGNYDAIIASLSAITGGSSPKERLVLCSRTSSDPDLTRYWNVFCEPISFPALLASLSDIELRETVSTIRPEQYPTVRVV